MRRYIPRPSARLKLLVSAALFLLSLLFLWSALSYPMPTQGLAHTKALREHGMPPGTYAASGRLRWEEGEGQNIHWYVTRQADGFAVTTPSRSAGLFWESFSFYFLRFTGEQPLPFCYLGTAFLFGVENGHTSTVGTENATLVASKDPAVARVELIQGWYNSKTDSGGGPRAWLEQNGAAVDCVETAPGSGLWLGRQVWPDAHGASATLVRAYDAQGTLLYENSDFDE